MKPLRKLASITSFDFQEPSIVGKEVILSIEGMLSDPLWEVKEEIIDVDIPKSKILVRIWVTRNPNLMAAHVTKKFFKEVKIVFPHAGKWDVQVNDKNLETIVE